MEGFLNLKETMAFLGANKQTIEKFVRAKRLTAYKIGGKYLRFRKDELLLIKHELEAERNESSFFFNPVVQNVLLFNGFYAVMTLVLSAVLVYFLVT